MARRDTEVMGLSLALAVAVLWAIPPICQKSLLDHLPRETIFALSTAVYASAALMYCAWHRDAILASLPKVSARHGAVIVLYTVFGAFLANILFLHALRDNSSVVVTALAYTSPVFTLLLAALVLRERISVRTVLGVVVVVFGVVLLVTA